MNDFDRVADVIRYLDQNHEAQPSLAQAAANSGLSQSHFHRLFRRWAGVTPKDFLQCLTAEHAKRRLRESASVLDAALEAGLSGPGRLHDLLVTIEGASPGDVKRGGQGMEIVWGRVQSPFGGCTIGWNSRGICHLAFEDKKPTLAEPPELLKAWPKAYLSRNDREARHWAKLIFCRKSGSKPTLSAFVPATAFQLKVWRALVRVPEGCVVSYHSIAEHIGSPQAARAVGTACGSNCVAYLIPCHRVIRETGVVQGYRWGTIRKQALLGWEFSKQNNRGESRSCPRAAAGRS